MTAQTTLFVAAASSPVECRPLHRPMLLNNAVDKVFQTTPFRYLLPSRLWGNRSLKVGLL